MEVRELIVTSQSNFSRVQNSQLKTVENTSSTPRGELSSRYFEFFWMCGVGVLCCVVCVIAIVYYCCLFNRVDINSPIAMLQDMNCRYFFPWPFILYLPLAVYFCFPLFVFASFLFLLCCSIAQHSSTSDLSKFWDVASFDRTCIEVFLFVYFVCLILIFYFCLQAYVGA